MKTAIVAVLLVLSGALFAGAQEPDVKFAALVLWGSDLEAKANVWNEHCKDAVATPQCVQTAALLDQLQVFWIQTALRYTQTGSDKFSGLKFRTVRHQINTFTWNVNCGGRELTKDEFAQCHEQSVKDEAEKDALQKEIIEWESSQKNSKL